MGMKTGLMVGFGVGYVLGAKAGRERYEQIRQAWSHVSGSPAMQRVADKTREAAGAGARRGMYVVQRGVERAGGAVRDRLHHGEDLNQELIDRLQEQSGSPPEDTTPPTVDRAVNPN